MTRLWFVVNCYRPLKLLLYISRIHFLNCIILFCISLQSQKSPQLLLIFITGDTLVSLYLREWFQTCRICLGLGAYSMHSLICTRVFFGESQVRPSSNPIRLQCLGIGQCYVWSGSANCDKIKFRRPFTNGGLVVVTMHSEGAGLVGSSRYYK